MNHMAWFEYNFLNLTDSLLRQIGLILRLMKILKRLIFSDIFNQANYRSISQIRIVSNVLTVPETVQTTALNRNIKHDKQSSRIRQTQHCTHSTVRIAAIAITQHGRVLNCGCVATCAQGVTVKCSTERRTPPTSDKHTYARRPFNAPQLRHGPPQSALAAQRGRRRCPAAGDHPRRGRLEPGVTSLTSRLAAHARRALPVVVVVVVVCTSPHLAVSCLPLSECDAQRIVKYP